MPTGPKYKYREYPTDRFKRTRAAVENVDAWNRRVDRERAKVERGLGKARQRLTAGNILYEVSGRNIPAFVRYCRLRKLNIGGGLFSLNIPGNYVQSFPAGLVRKTHGEFF